MKVFAIVLLTLLVIDAAFGTLSCFSQEEISSPFLPQDAAQVTLLESNDTRFACAKMYKQVKEYNLLTGVYISIKTSFSWAHKKFTAPKVIPEGCGDMSENSYIVNSPEENVTRTYYIRYCSCCGDNCNGQEMDDQCDAEPIFSHNCYADDRSKTYSDPLLPAHTRSIPCTARQFCFKSAVHEPVNRYTWGCASYQRVDRCGSVLIYYHPPREGATGPGHFDKVCTCCGDRCNGKDLDGTTLNGTYCGPVVQTGRTCYSAHSETPKFPQTELNLTFTAIPQEISACTKTFVRHFDFDIVTGKYIGMYTAYNWFVKPFTAPNLIPEHCGDTIEESYVMTLPLLNVTRSYYKRYCTCCGQSCNGPDMDDKCTEEPVFTHQCYGDDKNDETHLAPSLPSNARLVLCTDTEMCYKRAFMDVTPYYSWGCVNYPRVHSCKQPLIYHHPASGSIGKHIDKVCPCCGNLCNGKNFDEITANNTDCGPVTNLGKTCFFHYNSTSPKLPPEAFNSTAPNIDQTKSACTKMHQVVKEYDKKTGHFFGKTITYSWFAKEFIAPRFIAEKCNDTIEDSYLIHYDHGVTSVTYRRYCTCCGESCNGPEMDDVCNEEPVFTHECFANDRNERVTGPKLPENALAIPCTVNQICYKTAVMEGKSNYTWGCAHYPSIVTPVDKPLLYRHSVTGKTPHLDKICMCLGNRCNAFSETVLNNTLCSHAEPNLKTSSWFFTACFFILYHLVN